VPVRLRGSKIYTLEARFVLRAGRDINIPARRSITAFHYHQTRRLSALLAFFSLIGGIPPRPITTFARARVQRRSAAPRGSLPRGTIICRGGNSPNKAPGESYSSKEEYESESAFGSNLSQAFWQRLRASYLNPDAHSGGRRADTRERMVKA